jgi:hypothetical protein
MKQFYYTQVTKTQHEDEVDMLIETGYSFDLDSVLLTYPVDKKLAVVLKNSADKMNPTDYQYKINPVTKQKEPVKISKFEITSEPIVIELTVMTEINEFFKLTGGPTWTI